MYSCLFCQEICLDSANNGDLQNEGQDGHSGNQEVVRDGHHQPSIQASALAKAKGILSQNRRGLLLTFLPVLVALLLYYFLQEFDLF
jgi:hypothetical protein